jgi:hypothetical protein
MAINEPLLGQTNFPDLPPIPLLAHKMALVAHFVLKLKLIKGE